MVLCQRCHRRYDRQFRRKTGARTHAPIGCIKVFVLQEDGGEVLAEYARTYDELRRVVSSLPDDTDFTCLAEINGAVVGNGAYTKINNDKIILHNEYGACAGLHPQLYPIGRIR